MLNLFLLVTLNQFDEFERKDINPVEKFQDLTHSFKIAWNNYSIESDNGLRIKDNQMANFLMSLEGDLAKSLNSFKKGKNLDSVKKYISELELLMYYIQF
jgi:hypothetical protein